jgi:hypothetical protein
MLQQMRHAINHYPDAWQFLSGECLEPGYKMNPVNPMIQQGLA